MPRDGSGVYSKPAGTTAVSGDPISSTSYNTFVDDLVADANAARPVVAGGTGATTAANARTSLGVGTSDAPTFAGATFTGTTSVEISGSSVSLRGDIGAGSPGVRIEYSGESPALIYTAAEGDHLFINLPDDANGELRAVNNTKTEPDSPTTWLTRLMGDGRYQLDQDSSRRYKPGARFADRDFGDVIDALAIHEWTWGGELAEDHPKRGRKGLGLIAEDVLAELPEAVTYRNGVPNGLDSLPLIGALWAEVQSLRERVAELEGTE